MNADDAVKYGLIDKVLSARGQIVPDAPKKVEAGVATPLIYLG
jgi:hypothetical protein